MKVSKHQHGGGITRALNLPPEIQIRIVWDGSGYYDLLQEGLLNYVWKKVPEGELSSLLREGTSLKTALVKLGFPGASWFNYPTEFIYGKMEHI